MKAILGVLCCLIVFDLAAQENGPPQALDSDFSSASSACVVTSLETQKPGRVAQSLPGIEGQSNVVRRFRTHACYLGDDRSKNLSVVISQHDFVPEDHKQYLLFTKRSSGASETYIDVRGIPNTFEVGSSSLISGAPKLQEDAAHFMLKRGSVADESDIIHLLSDFATLTPVMIRSLRQTAHSPDVDVALLSYAELLRRGLGEPDDLAQLLVLLKDPKVSTTLDLGDVSWIMMENARPEDLPSLEALADSERRDVRIGTMVAIRHLATPEATPFLIEKLTDSDLFTAYTAVLALSDIYKKRGDFAPNMGSFGKERSRYIGLWKRWYANP